MPTNKNDFTTNTTFIRSCGTSYYAWVVAVDNVGNISDIVSLGSTSDGVIISKASWKVFKILTSRIICPTNNIMIITTYSTCLSKSKLCSSRLLY